MNNKIPNEILIVIDMQNDFVSGSLGSQSAKEIISAIATEIKKYKNNSGYVIFTKDTHSDDYLKTNEGKHLPIRHCIKNTNGWQIVPELAAIKSETRDIEDIIIEKPTFGYTEWNKYHELLEHARIKLCGVCTDICVVSNALILKALFPAADIIVEPRLCAGTSVDNHNAAITVMRQCHVDIIN